MKLTADWEIGFSHEFTRNEHEFWIMIVLRNGVGYTSNKRKQPQGLKPAKARLNLNALRHE
jgi:hypothetical protein